MENSRTVHWGGWKTELYKLCNYHLLPPNKPQTKPYTWRLDQVLKGTNINQEPFSCPAWVLEPESWERGPIVQGSAAPEGDAWNWWQCSWLSPRPGIPSSPAGLPPRLLSHSTGFLLEEGRPGLGGRLPTASLSINQTLSASKPKGGDSTQRAPSPPATTLAQQGLVHILEWFYSDF